MLPSINHILNTLTWQLSLKWIILADYDIDHICYRCETDDHYIIMKHYLSNLSQLLHENIIDKRPISIRKLDHPLHYKEYTIPCIELSAPKENNTHHNGREHIEVIVDDLEAFDEQYGANITERKGFSKSINRDLEIEFPWFNSNGGQYAIKFHEQSIEAIIKQEKIES